MVFFLILVALWVFFAPFVILSKIDSAEERLNQALEKKISESEHRLKQQFTALHPETAVLSPGVSDGISEEAAPASPAAYEISQEFGTVFVPDAEPVPPLEADISAPASALTSNLNSNSNLHSYSTLPPAGETSAETIPEAEEISAPEDEALLNEILLNGTGSEAEQAPRPSAPPFVPASVPEEPGIFEQTFQKFWSWLLTEGNIWVCAGVLLFLVGFGLLFNYAIQRGVLTLEMRLAAAAVTGLAMTCFGFQLRERRRAYGLILQGGGMGVLYLVVLAAAKFPAPQPILAPAFAIAAMLVLSVFTVLLALLQDYQPLALAAILGGFAAPLLVSAGSRNYVALFSIYSLLNLEILALSFRRDWRILSRAGFILSLVIGTAWGISDWRPELFNSVEPFLLIFFLTYTLIAVAAPGKNRAPDFFLALGSSFGFFSLQTQMAGHLRYGMALTCLGLGLWHLLIGAWLRREGEKGNEEGGEGNELRKTRRTLSHLYIFLCLLFSNLIIPYTFDSSTSSAAWAIEGAFLIAAACRTGSYKALLGGLALHTGALAFYCRLLADMDWSGEARLSPFFVSGALFAFSLLCSGFEAARFRPKSEGALHDKWEEALQGFSNWGSGEWVREGLSWTLTVLGAFAWWGTLYDQFPRLGVLWLGGTWTAFFVISCLSALAGCWLAVRFGWKAARFLLACPIAVPFVASLYSSMAFMRAAPFSVPSPFLLLSSLMHLPFSALVYVICVGGSLVLLRKAGRSVFSPFTLFAALWSGLLLTERALQGPLLGSWNLTSSILPLFALLLYVQRFCPELRRPRDDGQKKDALSVACATGVILFFHGWRFPVSFSSPGSAVRDVFIPLLNPLELWQALVLVSLFLWTEIFVTKGRPFGNWPKGAQWAAAGLFFAWLNQAAVRASWHYWGEAPYYSFAETLYTASCQAVIAIVWGALGLGCVLCGQRTRSRALWFAGAALIAADTVKLFLVDLNRTATLVRILAFLVLGGLSLLIGWAAPLPPKKEEEE